MHDILLQIHEHFLFGFSGRVNWIQPTGPKRPLLAWPRGSGLWAVRCSTLSTADFVVRGQTSISKSMPERAFLLDTQGHPIAIQVFFFHRAFCLEFQRLHHTCSPPRTALCKPKSPHTAFVSSAELGGADRRTSPWTHWASSAIISFAATGLSVEGLTSLNKPGQMM